MAMVPRRWYGGADYSVRSVRAKAVAVRGASAGTSLFDLATHDGGGRGLSPASAVQNRSPRVVVRPHTTTDYANAVGASPRISPALAAADAQ